MYPEIVTCEKQESEYDVAFNLSETEKFAKNNKLSHKTIIICLDFRSQWDHKPRKVKKTHFDNENVVQKRCDWYELPARISKSSFEPNISFVGPLSERPYIRVVDSYNEVKILSEKKGSQITVDDVLFASRALCGDATRSVDSYTVLSDNGSTLKLKAEIDNWST